MSNLKFVNHNLDIDLIEKIPIAHTQSETEQIKISFKNALIPYHGIFLGLLSALFLAFSNILIKKAYITSGSEQALSRYIVQGITMTIIILANSKVSFLGPKNSRNLLMLRAVFGTVGLISIHFSVKIINPSDAVALFHLNTVMVTVFARIFLKEKMSMAHFACILTSFFGVLLIAQPSFIFDNNYSNGFENSTSLSQNMSGGVIVERFLPYNNQQFIIGITLGI